MDDIWSILGIEPTDDKKAIRKAFAAQSRLHHPEEEPEYFAALNQAYKAALDQGAGADRIPFPAETLSHDNIYGAKAGGMSRHFISSPEDTKDEKEETHGESQQEKGQQNKDQQNKGRQNKDQQDEEEVRESSLLDRLDEAAKQAMQKSMETGALHDFIVLFENPKQAKQADTWKRFFLTESFLGEQF